MKRKVSWDGGCVALGATQDDMWNWPTSSYKTFFKHAQQLALQGMKPSPERVHEIQLPDAAIGLTQSIWFFPFETG